MQHLTLSWNRANRSVSARRMWLSRMARSSNQLAEKIGIPHRVGEETYKAQWDQLNGFRKRNSDTTLRKLEATPVPFN
jgi:hypothetical protein